MSGPEGSFKMEPETDMVLVVIFLSIVTLITALMNSAVILTIINTKKLHLPANYLICSLAVTDFLVAILVMPLSVLYIATKKWLLGCVVCEAWLSVDMTCCTCSILHLCAIALDRHWAITNALEYACKRTPCHVAIMVTIAWTISVLISVPPLLRRHSGDDNFGNYTKCLIEHDHIGYTIYSTFGAFYIPMAIILILYYRIFIAARTLYQKRSSSGAHCKRRASSHNCLSSCRVTPTSLCASEQSASDPVLNTELNILNGPNLHKSDSGGPGGTCDERTQICASRERKAARTLGLILGAFILCWLPFFVKELLVGLRVFHASAQVSDFLTWLGYVNSLINPLLYTSFNEDFKQAFKKLLRCKECK
ncbi:5-hydroxytryptamine receptor 1E-like [Salvelinus fontinalis]|uniref:5-hydroxytryptamine receptor 1E-like n=1 Tax=Salvelinus fontinalis TaxID=8038 RepID=UPI002484FB12|nr:5-hydroxytryptamine receptor 1E-like [Salvelinus fontinalis]